MKSFAGRFMSSHSPEGGSEPGRISRLMQAVVPALIAIAVVAVSYVLIRALLREDQSGARTLHAFAPLVNGLRWSGFALDQAAKALTRNEAPLLVGAILLIIAGISVFALRRIAHLGWRAAIGIALLFPALAASALLFRMGNAWGGAAAGLVAGAALLDQASGSTGNSGSSRFLWLIPLLLGFLLRFYALGEVPNGYAEHAAVQHADFSIPYSEALLTSIRAGSFEPFATMAWNALLREHSGPFTLVDAMGFALFGVSLLVSRIVSAVLGTLTIYVAFRLGEALEGRRLALVFSLLIALSPWHVAISRYGTAEHVLSPLHFLLALLFTVRALKFGKPVDAVLAAVVTAFAWVIYASNLVVPLVVATLLVFAAVRNPAGVRRHWKLALFSLACFGLISYVLLSKSFPNGILQPNIRTGYLGSGSLLSDWPKRLNMIGQEAQQLLVLASDPWFSLPIGGGLSLLEAVLLVPGILLSWRAFRDRHQQTLGLLVAIGLPLAAVPAILAPDVSFRRLTLVATLVTLAAAFALLHLSATIQGSGVSRRAVTAAGVIALAVVTASSAFTYFDRVVVGEEQHNAWFRDLVSTAIDNLGHARIILVTPWRNQHVDVDRYVSLMAYDELLAARQNGIPRGDLYQVTSCEEPIGAGGRKETLQPPPVIVVATDIAEYREPCTQAYLAKLGSHYPGSIVIVAKPAAPSGDLAPAPP